MNSRIQILREMIRITEPDLFKTAIVRRPGKNFADGLTTFLGETPDYEKALVQHGAYCAALEERGLNVVRLGADLGHPDSTFVEDVAVVTPDFAVVTRPGAESRRDEVNGIREPLARFFSAMYEIVAPGTLDGGDICEAREHFFIGISERTNEDGARQLAKIVGRHGYTACFVDIRGMKNILHLKSGIACVGEKQLVVWREFASREEFHRYELICVDGQENYAANCVRVNDHVLVAKGFPRIAGSLADRGFVTRTLDVSEFQKMDGGLSCLSLRF